MKQVQITEILGQPKRIDHQVACPSCSARAMAFEDGSVACIAEGKSFSPDARDGFLFDLRKQFDEKNGISIADRLNAVIVIHQGELSDRPTHTHG